MDSSSTRNLGALVGAAGMLCFAVGLSFVSPDVATGEQNERKKGVPTQADDNTKLVTAAEARERAKLMHSIYAATLDAMHHHFFRRERAVLPARAMEDVFAEMDKQSNIKAGWISVNTKAMSLHHEPKSEFEKNAAKAIAAGKGEFELIENGFYYRAGAIPLGTGCVACHTGFFSNTPQTERFAGLVISMPIKKE